MLLNGKSPQFQVIQSHVSNPVALTFDIARGWYYWADGKGNIYRSDGQQSSTVYSGELTRGVVCIHVFKRQVFSC